MSATSTETATKDSDLIVCAMPSCVAKRAKDRDTLLEAAAALSAEAESIRMAYKIKAGAGFVADNAEKRLLMQYERLANRLMRMADGNT